MYQFIDYIITAQSNTILWRLTSAPGELSVNKLQQDLAIIVLFVASNGIDFNVILRQYSILTSIWNMLTGCYKLFMFDYLRKYVFYLDLDPFNYIWPFDWDMWYDIAKTISWALSLLYYLLTPFFDSIYDNNFNNSRYCCSYNLGNNKCNSYKYMWIGLVI